MLKMIAFKSNTSIPVVNELIRMLLYAAIYFKSLKRFQRGQNHTRWVYKDFLDIKDDWNTQAQKLCLLPSMVGFCYDYGYPVKLPDSVKSMDYPAEFGTLYGATDTTEIQYSIPGANFIIDPGYRKKLVDDPIVDKVRKLIPSDAVDFFLTRPENKTWSTWRMRHISRAIGKTLDLYNLYPDKQTRSKLKQYAQNDINAQQFYNSDTYYYYLDRMSGKTMNFSLGAEVTKGNPYSPPSVKITRPTGKHWASRHVKTKLIT